WGGEFMVAAGRAAGYRRGRLRCGGGTTTTEQPRLQTLSEYLRSRTRERGKWLESQSPAGAWGQDQTSKKDELTTKCKRIPSLARRASGGTDWRSPSLARRASVGDRNRVFDRAWIVSCSAMR